jgi:hypothetical protein
MCLRQISAYRPAVRHDAPIAQTIIKAQNEDCQRLSLFCLLLSFPRSGVDPSCFGVTDERDSAGKTGGLAPARWRRLLSDSSQKDNPRFIGGLKAPMMRTERWMTTNHQSYSRDGIIRAGKTVRREGRSQPAAKMGTARSAKSSLSRK